MLVIAAVYNSFSLNNNIIIHVLCTIYVIFVNSDAISFQTTAIFSDTLVQLLVTLCVLCQSACMDHGILDR